MIIKIIKNTMKIKTQAKVRVKLKNNKKKIVMKKKIWLIQNNKKRCSKMKDKNKGTKVKNKKNT